MIPNRVFTSIDDAIAALVMDKLGTVYVRAKTVWIATAHGSGVFIRGAWMAAGGCPAR